VTTSIIDSLEEDVVQSVDLSAMLSRSSWNFVDCLESNLLALASELFANLLPQLSKPLFHSCNIRVCYCQVGPSPRVVVDVDNGVQSAVCDHVYDV